MARRAPKKTVSKPRRTNSMEKCVLEAREYLKNNKRRRINKTRTMARTIQKGKSMLARKRNNRKVGRLENTSKRPKRATLRSRPVVPSAPVVPTSISAISSITIPTIFRARSTFQTILPTQGTRFTKKSKDNLPYAAYGFIDVCFCIQSTESMRGELAQIQSTIVEIIKRIQNTVRTEGVTLRFAVVAYHDHCDPVVVEFQDFTDAIDTIEYLKNLRVSEGGDKPEAAHDGLLTCLNRLNWIQVPGNVIRYIFHILDSPPHGKEFTNQQPKNGCTCGRTTGAVKHEMVNKQINYRMIKARKNPKVDKAEEILRTGFPDYKSADIGHASQMDIRVSDMIIQDILPRA